MALLRCGNRAFAVKLTLRKVAGYYSDLKRARLAERAPELEDYVAAPRLRTLFEEFRETHKTARDDTAR
jgi:hypothetical protein